MRNIINLRSYMMPRTTPLHPSPTPPWFHAILRQVTLGGVISGDGALIINSDSTSSGSRILFSSHNTFTGDVYIQKGYVAQSFADSLGTANKTLHSRGTCFCAVAAPVGSLAVMGTVYVSSGATVVFDVKGATFNVGGTAVGDIASLYASQLDDVGNHDYLEVVGALNLSAGQSLQFNPLNGYLPTWGDAFHLLDFGVLSAGVLTPEQMWLLPTLADANWEWNFDLFNQYGILVVTPEPTRGLLLLLAAMGVILRRHRMQSRF